MQGTQPIDMVSLTGRCFNDGAFVKELVDIFVDQAVAQVPLLHSAASAGDWKRVGDIAHKLKGSAANVTALPLHGLCEMLEKSARTGSVEEVKGMIPAVQSEIDRCRQFAAEQVSKLPT